MRTANLARCYLYLLLVLATPVWAADTLVVLVRHAEKATDDARDPSLSEAGIARAQNLSRVLSDYRLQAAWVTQFQRTQLTAAPAAAAAGIEAVVHEASATVAEDARALAHKILEQQRGQSVLVVGHSNTVGAIVQALGGDAGASIAEDEYDRVYVLNIAADKTVRTLLLRY